jgi:DNA (cytosine-5)-methyltransferase 1
LRHLDLFSGIGGFALAARWAGWETVQFVEIDSFCQAVLKKNFPNIPIHDDIRTLSFTDPVDVISGGFPCQPFSVAGKQKGKDDNRHLWPELIKQIRTIRPSYVVCENVPGIIKLALEEVCTDLEAEGYSVETFIIPACGVGAIHKRDRVWIIAYSNQRLGEHEEKQIQTRWNTSDHLSSTVSITHPNSGEQSTLGRNVSQVSSLQKEECQSEYSTSLSGRNGIENVSNSQSERLSERNGEQVQHSSHPTTERYDGVSAFENFPTEPPICGADARLPNRVERIKSLGNSIVPQIAYEIFKAINSLH